MTKKIDDIIKESVRKTFLEMDLTPLNRQGEANLAQNQSVNA